MSERIDAEMGRGAPPPEPPSKRMPAIWKAACWAFPGMAVVGLVAGSLMYAAVHDGGPVVTGIVLVVGWPMALALAVFGSGNWGGLLGLIAEYLYVWSIAYFAICRVG